MIKLRYRDFQTTMSEEDLMALLQASELPWYMDSQEVFVIGYDADITIQREAA